MLSGRTCGSMSREKGVALLEALVSVLIFSLGILSLVGLQSVMVRSSIDAKYRADAAFLANQIVGSMWAADRSVLSASFAHNAGGEPCADVADNDVSALDESVQDWMARVQASLPGASDLGQQITVDADNLVTVTLCWKNVQDSTDGSALAAAPPHNFVLTTRLADQ